MGKSIRLYWRGMGGYTRRTDVFYRFPGSVTIKEDLHKRKENTMKAEKMVIEMEKAESKRQGRRLISYRDKLREACKDTSAKKEGNTDVQGRE